MKRITPAQKIKQLREKRNLTQEQLADKLRVSVGTIKNWENGTSEPSLSIAEDLADVLGVYISDLHSTTLKKDEMAERIEQEMQFKEMSKKRTAQALELVDKWLKQHPESAFKPGFNSFNFNYYKTDDRSIRKIYGEEFFKSAFCSISNVGVIVKRLKDKNYLLMNGHASLGYGIYCDVFLRDEQEAKNFTRDLALALTTPAEYGNTIEETIYEDFSSVLNEADRSISALLTRMVYETKRVKYVVAIFNEENIIEHVFRAADNDDLVKKMEAVKPKYYSINNLEWADSCKLYEKVCAKTSKK